MLEKVINYIDEMTGEPAQMTAWFNITKAEAMEFNIRRDLVVIGASRDQNQLMDTFNKLLATAYGVQTPERKFVKKNVYGQDLFDEFRTTEAYSTLFMEIFSDKDYALEFIKSILPKDIVADGEAQQSQGNVPETLQNHPSMQGYQTKKQPETRREARNDVRGTEFDEDHQRTQPNVVKQSAAQIDPEYAEFLRYKQEMAERNQKPQTVDSYMGQNDASTTPPDRVSPPEALQTGSDSPRDELI